MRLFFVLCVTLTFSAVWSQTTPFSCPATYVPPDTCTEGPCRCAQFNTVYIGTDTTSTPHITTITIRVTNYCTDPVYYVQFAITDTTGAGYTPLLTTGTYVSSTTSGYSWTVSVFDGTQPATLTSPSIKWLRFTSSPNPNTQMTTPSTSLSYDVFTFTVENYSPTFQWYYQMHQGSNWDTFGPIDNSLCQCGNCDAGFAQRQISACTLGYPSNENGRTPSVFNENECLYSFQILGNTLDMYFSDEHPMILGVNVIQDVSGIITQYPQTAMSNTPQCVSGTSLQLGTTDFNPFDVQSGVDGNDAQSSCTVQNGIGCGRPLAPTLFITDLAVNTANNRAGDWQFNGVAYLPQKVCGLWKNVTKTITSSGSTSTPPTFGIQVAADPTSNVNSARTGWNLGIGADPLPVGFVLAGAWVQSYGAEVQWDLDQLPLNASHSYRFQFITHDGDQTRIGGDVGQACIIASPACPAGFGPVGSCTTCDTSPLLVGYTYFCFPTGSSVDPYTLLKIPISKETLPLYAQSGGFVPAPGYVDAQGFLVSCDCKRQTQTCPKNCCGSGSCNLATGTCTCKTGLGVVDANCCPATINITTPCYNGGVFCSGHGSCVGTPATCQCITDASGTQWSGPNCSVPIVVPKTCNSLPNVTNCAQCSATAVAYGIYCQWCSQYALSDNRTLTVGTCASQTSCPSTSYQNPSCLTTIIYTPEPCPDACSHHGTCTNVSGAATGITASNTTVIPPWHLVCSCDKDYSGANCATHDNTVALAAGLGAAAVVGIVIAIVVVLAALGGGGYALAQNMAAAPVAPAMNNPLYVGAGQSGENPLNKR